jgi:hypothetical protein
MPRMEVGLFRRIQLSDLTVNGDCFEREPPHEKMLTMTACSQRNTIFSESLVVSADGHGEVRRQLPAVNVRHRTTLPRSSEDTLQTSCHRFSPEPPAHHGHAPRPQVVR